MGLEDPNINAIASKGDKLGEQELLNPAKFVNGLQKLNRNRPKGGLRPKDRVCGDGAWGCEMVPEWGRMRIPRSRFCS